MPRLPAHAGMVLRLGWPRLAKRSSNAVDSDTSVGKPGTALKTRLENPAAAIPARETGGGGQDRRGSRFYQFRPASGLG